MIISNATEWQMTKDEFLQRLGIPEDADVYHVSIRDDLVTVSAHAPRMTP